MLKKMCDLFTTIILMLLLVFAAILIVPKFLGFTSFAVLSGSMEPKIPVGAIVYVEEVDPNTLFVGDIVSYRLTQELAVTHRVESIDYQKKVLITKGDANKVADAEAIKFQNIIGKVKFHIPLLGYLSIYVKTPLGIAAACGVVFIILLVNFISEIFSKKNKK